MRTLEQVSELEWSSLSPERIVGDEGCPAWKYLAFATADIKDDSGDRSSVNAVGNAKRALHLRLENLAEAFGGRAILGTAPSFPEMLNFCRKCGIISPLVLQRLNRVRNTVEHQYYIPSVDEASDFVDIVSLFLEATNLASR